MNHFKVAMFMGVIALLIVIVRQEPSEMIMLVIASNVVGVLTGMNLKDGGKK